MAGENASRLAVLIDADNAQPTLIEELLAEVAKYGTAHVKRAYGDWTGTRPLKSCASTSTPASAPMPRRLLRSEG